MSREIKFRGLRIDTKEWVYGSLIQITNPHKIENECWATFIHEGPNISETIRVRMETVGEFTGLKDKNGKEIYEGDILIHGNGERHPAYVKYDAPEFVRQMINYASTYPFRNHHEYEIIGNIYEHPHLLK